MGKVESEAQSVVADIRIWEGILMNVPAVIYCFLAGDNNDKKMFRSSLGAVNLAKSDKSEKLSSIRIQRL